MGTYGLFQHERVQTLEETNAALSQENDYLRGGRQELIRLREQIPLLEEQIRSMLEQNRGVKLSLQEKLDMCRKSLQNALQKIAELENKGQDYIELDELDILSDPIEEEIEEPPTKMAKPVSPEEAEMVCLLANMSNIIRFIEHFGFFS